MLLHGPCQRTASLQRRGRGSGAAYRQSAGNGFRHAEPFGGIFERLQKGHQFRDLVIRQIHRRQRVGRRDRVDLPWRSQHCIVAAARKIGQDSKAF